MKDKHRYLLVTTLAIAFSSLPLPVLAHSGTENLPILVDTLFIFISAVLVILMNLGFALLEAGMCQSKNTVNILSKNLIVFTLAAVAYWAVGYGFAYGEGTPLIGQTGFLFNGSPAPYGNEGFPITVPETVSFLFQLAFAATAATIVSGAVAERIKYGAFILFSVLLTGIIYPISSHWVWTSTGLLADLGFTDFAGSTVVHSLGGYGALTGAILLGSRRKKDDNEIPGHNLSLATAGCLILFLGWLGFNPGSELGLTANVPHIVLTTIFAASSGAIAATFYSWIRYSKADLAITINGLLGGLVAITAGCSHLGYLDALLVGAIAGLIVMPAVQLVKKLSIDDPVGAISVHLVCGILGTLMLGVLSNEVDLYSQAIGVFMFAIWGLGTTTLAWFIVGLFTNGIRVSGKEEAIGLDLSEHGQQAYNGGQW